MTHKETSEMPETETTTDLTDETASQNLTNDDDSSTEGGGQPKPDPDPGTKGGRTTKRPGANK